MHAANTGSNPSTTDKPNPPPKPITTTSDSLSADPEVGTKYCWVWLPKNTPTKTSVFLLKVQNDTEQGQTYSTTGKTLDLHAANLGLIHI